MMRNCRRCVTDQRGSTPSCKRPTSAGGSCRSSTGDSRMSVKEPCVSFVNSLFMFSLTKSNLIWNLRPCVVFVKKNPQECPSGVVNEETFKSIYSQFFPHGGQSDPAFNSPGILISCVFYLYWRGVCRSWNHITSLIQFILSTLS